MTPDEKEILREFSRRPWQAKFHKSVENKTAPDGLVDMYILLDDTTGDQMVSIAVPHRCGYIAEWIANCCARPWFIDQRSEGDDMADIAVAFNRALKPFVDKDGQLDGRNVAIAAMSIMCGYVSDLPKHARDELANRLLVGINELMRME